MQGMRIKSHKGYFTNPQPNRGQARVTWAPQFFSTPRPAPEAKAAPVVVAPPKPKTAVTAKKRPVAKKNVRAKNKK